MKYGFLIVILFSMMSCSSYEEKTVSEKNCEKTCTLKLKEYQSYEESRGCFCSQQ